MHHGEANTILQRQGLPGEMTKAQHKAACETKRKVTSASTYLRMDEGVANSNLCCKPPKKSCTSPRAWARARGQHSNEDMPIIKDMDGSLALASDLLMNLPRDIWWRLLQDPDGKLEVKHNTWQDWPLIIPVYLQAALLSTLPIGMELHRLKFAKVNER